MKTRQLLAAALLGLAPPALAASRAPQPPAAGEATPRLVGEWEGEADQPRGWPLFLNLRVEERAGRLAGRLSLLGRRLDLARASRSASGIEVATAGADPIVVRARFEGQALVGEAVVDGVSWPLRLRPVPQLPPPRDRLEGWRQDLDTLATRFLAADRSFSPGEAMLFREALDAIRQDLPRLDDAEITTRMAAAVALAGNGHTRLYLLRNRQELRRLPIRLWWFSDGLFVVRAAAAQKDLLGCRVEAIEGLPARNARDRAAPLFAGTSGWIDYKTVYSLTSPETLHGIGLAPDMERIAFRFAGCPAAGVRTLAPLPLARSRAPVEAWWDLSPRFRAPGTDWAHVLDAQAAALPLYLRNEANYWFDETDGILYLQCNRSEQAEGETTEAFGKRLLDALERRRPRAFVLDLRFNTGGSMHYAEALMEALVRRTEGLQRFVIVGRATFSAGMSAALPWRRPGVTFVGEPIAERLDFWAEGGNIPLPYSGYDAHFANGFHSYSPAPCPQGIWCLDRSIDGLDPHVLATTSFADYAAGRDPAISAIAERLRKSAGNP
ncbi:hypothetical protein E2493_04530 [Sphingomonas parva]|uniref:Uncharacterized protein n=1 Tax=Sphingomonas parva TaxID=2555898 RepID=A0A4Y8ZTW2_9SPHN|nr:S41 family peptidase [Sphingomonas parva]TFI59463.1 hypothetical protein E2493_04530 [Sphingomonas parva]